MTDILDELSKVTQIVRPQLLIQLEARIPITYSCNTKPKD